MSIIYLLVKYVTKLICKKMNTDKEKCTTDDLEVHVKSKVVPRFKAGAELSGKVNRLAVEVNEEQTETSDTIEVKMVLSREQCSSCGCQD